jgi:3'-phosphoadenosine 5'-phosphosulfate sulfotransferase (PAPS reductase)/FAD synthetase
MIDTQVTNAMHRIEELYNETGGKCYVSFSGGKDSTVLLALIKMCEEILTIPPNGIPAVFSNTGIELGVTVDFVKWCRDSGWYPNIVMIRPEVSFDWVLKNKGKPMKSKIKSELMNRWHTGKQTEYVKGNLIYGISPKSGKSMRTKIADKDMHMVSDDFNIIPSSECCTYLKKNVADKWSDDNDMLGSMVGIRTGEGGVRKLQADRRVKEGGKLCTFTSHGKIKKAPIIDWTEDDVNEFVSTNNVPLSKAYTEFGFIRTGCMACPYSWDLTHDLKYLFDYEPNRYKASMHWLKDVYIAQNVILPFDPDYERERERMWHEVYEPMRQEMLRKYRPHSKLIKEGEQMTIFDYLEDE